MKLTEAQKQEITLKNNRLESIKVILNSKFIGINDVIDDIIDSMRPYYIFPESLKRPIVVNLWGLTGTGKTSVVNAIVEALSLEHKLLKFDIGEYANTGGEWKFRHDFSERTQKLKDKNLIFLLDEFQLGRTINENGAEIDRSPLRPVWELLDTGMIQRLNRKDTGCAELISKYQECISKGVVVENGVVVQGENIYNEIMKAEHLRPVDFVEYPHIEVIATTLHEIDKKNNKKNKPESLEPLTIEEQEDNGVEMYGRHTNTGYNLKKFRQPYFVKYQHFLMFYLSAPDIFNCDNSFSKWKSSFRDGQNLVDIIDRVNVDFSPRTVVMDNIDYRQSIVFIVGNIDEAYNMSHSADPDADADLFHENSLKITIPVIKKALCSRYRMEQIGRLGNNHIIYRAFNKKTYENIIKKYVNDRVEDFDKTFGIKLTFTKDFYDILYKESVFPSQGARPVMSSINGMIDSYTSKIIGDVILKAQDTDNIVWDFEYIDEQPFYNIKKYQGKKLLSTQTYPLKLNVESLRKTDNTEQQVFVAVHEAGHAVAAIMLLRLMPKEVRSRTASLAEGYCQISVPDSSTKHSMLSNLYISLAGLEAEKIVFGSDFMSQGGGSDLKTASQIANSMVKSFGMDNIPYSLDVPNPCHPNTFHSSQTNYDAEMQAIKIINDAQVVCQKCISDNLEFVLELATYLSKCSVIEEAELKEMALKYTTEDNFKTKDNYYNFKQILADRFKNVSERKIKAQSSKSLTPSLNGAK